MIKLMKLNYNHNTPSDKFEIPHILIISATIDFPKYERHFGSMNLITIQSQTHPIETFYLYTNRWLG